MASPGNQHCIGTFSFPMATRLLPACGSWSMAIIFEVVHVCVCPNVPIARLFCLVHCLTCIYVVVRDFTGI